MTETTIFSKILNGEIPCEKLHDDEYCIAFNDISAQAPVHFLVIPKKHIVSLSECMVEDVNLLGHLLFIGSKIAKSKNLSNWRTVINTGEESGQTVFHLHIHFLSGRKMKWPPG
ncbi:histidine triad nucleotide-binding protein [Prochlorococcus marinus]|uniref:histidine triad nucleotide-binding protein n=1 Tax=Prochlorococcus marinus TaxID=1219 RepID=UPI00019009D7|nr:histidine triad nucleotide-binding protein [Prochlorococcus marinus]EEE39741.1 histidine triad nucleotide-binding protein 1 [Prochlorococcus marinus str. MIT 9202]